MPIATCKFCIGNTWELMSWKNHKTDKIMYLREKGLPFKLLLFLFFGNEGGSHM